MIVILGGANDKNGNLDEFTIARIEKCLEINQNDEIILSGGKRHFNILHCQLVKEYILNKNNNAIISKLFIENNDTVDEAINISEYIKSNYIENLKIITSDWHLKRSKYLFDFCCKNNNNIKLEYISTTYDQKKYVSFGANIIDLSIIDRQEEEKLKILINKPYGKWYAYINKINSK